MDIKKIFEQAEKHGDFYMYYRKHNGKGNTYLVGTTEFDNKYIKAKHASGKAGVYPNVSLKTAADKARANGSVLIFSWTNDKFRTLKASDVRRLTPLSAELRNGNKR